MKLGMTFPQKWIEKSEKEDIPVSDILYGLAVEDLLMRIGKSSFQEYLWITNEQAIGIESYKKKNKEKSKGAVNNGTDYTDTAKIHTEKNKRSYNCADSTEKHR